MYSKKSLIIDSSSKLLGTSNSYKSIVIDYILNMARTIFIFIKNRSLVPKIINKSLVVEINLKLTFFIGVVLFIILGSSYDNQISEATSVEKTGYLAQKISLTANLLFVFVIFVVGVSCFYLLLISKRRITFYKIDVLVFLFLISQQLSSLTSAETALSVVWLLKLIRNIFIYILSSRLLFKQKELLNLIFIIAATVFLEAALTIIQFILGGSIGIPLETLGVRTNLNNVFLSLYTVSNFRSVGTFTHPNHLSAFLVIMLPFVITSILLVKRLYLKIFFLLTVVLSVLSTLLTFSRWGIVVCLLSLATTSFLINKHTSFKVFQKNTKFFFIGISLLFLFTIVNPFTSRRFLQIAPDDNSFQGRINLIMQSLYVIRNFPLGIGAGTFPVFFNNYDYTEFNTSQTFLSPVHNFYLLLATEGGLLGLFLFLLIIFFLFKLFLSKINVLEEKNKLISIALFSSLFIFLLHGVWEPHSVAERHSIIFWLVTGLLINILHEKNHYRS